MPSSAASLWSKQCRITSKLDQVGLFQLSSSNLQVQLSHSLSECLFQFLTMLTSVVWAHRKRPPGEAITQTGQPSARALPEEDCSGETGCRSRESEQSLGPLVLRRSVSEKHVQLIKLPRSPVDNTQRQLLSGHGMLCWGCCFPGRATDQGS